MSPNTTPSAASASVMLDCWPCPALVSSEVAGPGSIGFCAVWTGCVISPAPYFLHPARFQPVRAGQNANGALAEISTFPGPGFSVTRTYTHMRAHTITASVALVAATALTGCGASTLQPAEAPVTT